MGGFGVPGTFGLDGVSNTSINVAEELSTEEGGLGIGIPGISLLGAALGAFGLCGDVSGMGLVGGLGKTGVLEGSDDALDWTGGFGSEMEACGGVDRIGDELSDSQSPYSDMHPAPQDSEPSPLQCTLAGLKGLRYETNALTRYRSCRNTAQSYYSDMCSQRSCHRVHWVRREGLASGMRVMMSLKVSWLQVFSYPRYWHLKVPQWSENFARGH